MGVCKERKKRKRASRAVNLACEILTRHSICCHTDSLYRRKCSDEECPKCWKTYLYNEVEKK